MAKEKRMKTMVHNTLHRQQSIEQNESHLIRGSS